MTNANPKKKRVVRRVQEPRCRICGCTYLRSCPGGVCGWVEGDLCTVCAGFRETLQIYIEDCNRVTARSLTRLFREAA
jgi:hypothetical protein